MSLMVILIAGLPALLIFSFALISDSRSGLFGVAAVAVAFGLLTGAASFAVLDTFCVLVGLFLGIAQQNRRRVQQRLDDPLSDQLVTRHQAPTTKNGDQAQRTRPAVPESAAASDARIEPKWPKPIWPDTPEEEKAKLEKEHKEWLAHRNRSK